MLGGQRLVIAGRQRPTVQTSEGPDLYYHPSPFGLCRLARLPCCRLTTRRRSSCCRCCWPMSRQSPALTPHLNPTGVDCLQRGAARILSESQHRRETGEGTRRIQKRRKSAKKKRGSMNTYGSEGPSNRQQKKHLAIIRSEGAT